MKSIKGRLLRSLGWAAVASIGAAAPAMAGGPTASDWAERLGIPPEVAAVARFTHLAPAEPVADEDPSRAAGPDVIVSLIGSTFTKNGTVGDISAYSFTTVSCNIGNANAEWFAGVNRHPLIAQNLYRYKFQNGAGRFEHIGQAWLKHGWCAADASGSGCGTCPSPHFSCDWLAPNCSDTYGASLNADQRDLGPKSEVNASAASYPYPYQLAWNQTGSAIYKRLQVFNSDIDPTLNVGAQYFGEAHYVCTDENAHGTQYNNASWRAVARGSASGGGWNLGFTGSTMQQQQAIRAWKTIDNNVNIVDVFVPNDGMFTVGYRVTDLGNGKWDYEYAIHNYNSHRSAGSVKFPVPAGVEVSSTGFHDVFYHSGEPFSGDDWAVTNSSGSLAFATEPYASNSNANALRWSTLYNFRFVANQPPTSGTVEIGLFRPGAGDSVTFTGLVPSAPAPTCAADLNGSGDLDTGDFTAFRALYLAGDLSADFTNDGELGTDDFTAFRNAYLAGCP